MGGGLINKFSETHGLDKGERDFRGLSTYPHKCLFSLKLMLLVITHNIESVSTSFKKTNPTRISFINSLFLLLWIITISIIHSILVKKAN